MARFCRQCGNPVGPDNRFCAVCGSAVSAVSPQAAFASSPDAGRPVPAYKARQALVIAGALGALVPIILLILL